MKKSILITSLLMVISMSVVAYSPIFSEAEKAWSLHSSCHNYFIMDFEIGDTVIADTKYRKIRYENLSDNEVQIFCIRDDVKTKTIYIYDNAKSTDLFLFDFAIEDGITQKVSDDKEVVYKVLNKSQSYGYSVIDLEVSVKIGTKSWTYTDKWIEGVGGKYGLTHQPWMDDYYDECNENLLVCVSDAYDVLYKSEYADIYPCNDIVCYDCFGTDIKTSNTEPDKSIPHKQISPNGSFQILLPDGRRFDTTGREIK